MELSKLFSRSLLLILGLLLGLVFFVYACFNAGMSWLSKDCYAQVEMAVVAYLGHESKESVRDLILGACKAGGDYFKVAGELEDCLSFTVLQAVAEEEAAEKKKGAPVEAPSALAMMKDLAQSYPESPEILAITGCLLRNKEDVDHQAEALVYLKKAQALGLCSENLYADIANALSYLSDAKLIKTAEAKKALVTLQTKYGITKDNYHSLRWQALEQGLKKFPHSSYLLFLRSDLALREVWTCKPSEIDKYWHICKRDATGLVIEQKKLRLAGQGDDVDKNENDLPSDVISTDESVEGYYPSYYVRGVLMRGYATAMLGDVKAGEKDVLKAVADMLKIADEEESDSGRKEAHLWLARYYWDIDELQKAKEEYLKVKALPEEPAKEGTFIYSSNAESMATEWKTFSKHIK